MYPSIKKANHPFDIGMMKIITAKGLKHRCVAEKAGYTVQELSDMLNGRRLIKACDIPKLAGVLGVSPIDVYAAGEEV